MSKLNIAVAGADGRVGKLLVSAINDDDALVLAGALKRSDIELSPCDVLIDFSSPEGFRLWLSKCVDAGVPFVSGTTGLSTDDDAALDQAAKKIAVLHATNTSVGVVILNRLAADAARLLGDEFDIEIVETHHHHKKDAPSGTARTLAEHVRNARPDAGIHTHSLRIGDIVGEHTIHFAGEGERLSITHAATSRETFARGALRAARWIIHQPPGRYQITDVLG